MKENGELNEKELDAGVYLSKAPIFLMVFSAFFIISISFFMNFPTRQKIERALEKALKSSPLCKMNYSKLNLKFFFNPSINLTDLVVPGYCFNSRGSNLNIDEINLVLKRPTIVPPGFLFHLSSDDSNAKVSLFASTGINSATLRLENSEIDGSLISLIAKLPIKIQGTLSADAILETDYKIPTSGSFHITSKNLNLPPQSASGFEIKGISLAPMILKGTLNQGTVTLSKFQIGNANTKVEAIFGNGTIKLNSKNPSLHIVDIAGRVRFSSEFIKEFPFISFFMNKAKMDSNGFYRLELKGPISTLSPKFL